MGERLDDLSRAREHVGISWNEEREARLRRGVERRQRTARAARVAAVAACVVAAGATLVAVLGDREETTRIADEGRAVEERVETAAREDVAQRPGAIAATESETPSAAATEGEPPDPARVVAADASAAAPTPPSATRRSDAKASQWRTLVAAGQHSEAYELLVSSGARVPHSDPVALMEAADAARLSGHPEAATDYLDTVLRRHRKHALAPLAAFTLGRLLLDRLGQPREAAAAFARARELSPKGSLAEDALAREVEAWSKSGDAALARARADEYLGRYPQGRRIRAVKLYGGIE
jgi:transmembrane sensor